MEKPLQANRFMFLFMIYMAVVPTVIQLAFYFLTPTDEMYDIFRKYFVMFGHALIFGVPLIVLCLSGKTKLGELIPHEKLSIGSIVLIFFISFLIMPIMAVASAITAFYADDTAYKEAGEFVSQYSLGYMIFTVAVMPAFFEEIIFRGVIMTGFKRCGMFVSLLFSALYFGIMHMSLYQLLYAIMAGFILGMLAQYANSIYASILAHFIINGSQVFIGWLVGDDTAEMSEAAAAASDVSNMEMLYSALVLLVVTLPLLLLLLGLYVKINKGKETEYKYSLSGKHEFETELVYNRKKYKPIDIFFVLVIMLYVVYVAFEAFFAT